MPLTANMVFHGVVIFLYICKRRHRRDSEMSDGELMRTIRSTIVQSTVASCNDCFPRRTRAEENPASILESSKKPNCFYCLMVPQVQQYIAWTYCVGDGGFHKNCGHLLMTTYCCILRSRNRRPSSMYIGRDIELPVGPVYLGLSVRGYPLRS